LEIEVDVLYETPRGLQAIEIKSGSTFASDWPTAVRKWQTLAGGEALTPIIIYGGKRRIRARILQGDRVE